MRSRCCPSRVMFADAPNALASDAAIDFRIENKA
jgi:hypothetical protein